MISCVNKLAPEFRKFQLLTGLNESDLELAIAMYLDEHNGAWPESVDEIRGANTEESFKNRFKLSRYNSTDVESVLQETSSNNIPEAIAKINDTYSDAVTDYTVVQDRVLFTRELLPSKYKFNKTEGKDVDSAESKGFISSLLNRLSKLYGINTIQVTTSDLKAMGILEQVPESASVSAFILNGDIYVNTDIASIHAPSHELMHVFMGSIKYKYPQIYASLVDSVRNLPNINDRVMLYSGRTESDILEEVFVEEYSRYLNGLKSSMDLVDPEILYKIDHKVSRMLDVILMGDNSVEVVPANLRFSQSIANLGKLVNSSNMVNEGLGFLDSAILHRIMGNLKSNLMKSGDLREECV